jgi:chemotaxis signal transduction protein
VLCGPWALAFPFSWARNLIEDIELCDVPHAPAWLLGAANVDGAVIPVFDLACWLDPAQATPPGPGRYVLVGGDGECAAGLIFRGLPTLVNTVGGVAPNLPPALAEFARGAAVDGTGRPWAVIDAPALLEAWAAELSLA